MSEVWKPVVGYEGYQVSNNGNIRSFKRYPEGKMLHPTVSKRQGRVSVMLIAPSGKPMRVSLHRIVAMAFVDNPNPKEFVEVNHKDENPLNNNADNLEWCSHSYNMHYNNLHQRIKRYKRPVEAVNKDTGESMRFESIREAKKYGFDSSGIFVSIHSPLKNGNKRKYKGYYWRFI